MVCQVQYNRSPPAHGLANGTTAVMHHLTWDTVEKAAAAQLLIDDTPPGEICCLPLNLRPTHIVIAFRPRAPIPNAPECSNQRFGMPPHAPRPEQPAITASSSETEQEEYDGALVRWQKRVDLEEKLLNEAPKLVLMPMPPVEVQGGLKVPGVRQTVRCRSFSLRPASR